MGTEAPSLRTPAGTTFSPRSLRSSRASSSRDVSCRANSAISSGDPPPAGLGGELMHEQASGQLVLN
jgi:hypothetical protein